MAKFELKLPKMGESVAEATITNWLKEVGDTIEADEAIIEIATDKIDSEVLSEVYGVLVKKNFDKDDVVQVGQTIAIIETDIGEGVEVLKQEQIVYNVEKEVIDTLDIVQNIQKEAVKTSDDFSDSNRFYSPLVKNIATTESVTLTELGKIKGSGKEGRVTKNDILDYVTNKGRQNSELEIPVQEEVSIQESALQHEVVKETVVADQISVQEVVTPETPIQNNVAQQEVVVDQLPVQKVVTPEMPIQNNVVQQEVVVDQVPVQKVVAPEIPIQNNVVQQEVFVDQLPVQKKVVNPEMPIQNIVRQQDADTVKTVSVQKPIVQTESLKKVTEFSKAPVSVNGSDEILEMDRMGKMISHHMIQSVQTSAHVQSFIEVDVTNIWKWREKNKDAFEKREGGKINFHSYFYGGSCKNNQRFSYG